MQCFEQITSCWGMILLLIGSGKIGDYKMICQYSSIARSEHHRKWCYRASLSVIIVHHTVNSVSHSVRFILTYFSWLFLYLLPVISSFCCIRSSDYDYLVENAFASLFLILRFLNFKIWSFLLKFGVYLRNTKVEN